MKDVIRQSLSTHPTGRWFGLAVVEPKNILNFGSIARLAVNYGASVLFLVRPRFCYKRAATDTYHAARNLPIVIVDNIPEIPEVTKVWFDFSTRAVPLPAFRHPKRALYIIGGEDRTLNPPKNEKNIVYVPTVGSLNIAVAVGTILYDRLFKEGVVSDLHGSN